MKTLEIPGIDIVDLAPAYDFWLIMAWWPGYSGWKIFKDMYASVNDADKTIADLQNTGWKHIQLLHVTPQTKG